jgi:hypothetical protein
MPKSKYDKAKLKIEFLERIAGGESHSEICLDKHMPNWSTVWRWAKADKEFEADLESCKFERGCLYGYKVGEIASDLYENAETQTHEMVAAKRAAMDGYKWSAARMAGVNGWNDKVSIEHTAGGTYVEALQSLAIEKRTEERAQEVRAQTSSQTDDKADNPASKALH